MKIKDLFWFTGSPKQPNQRRKPQCIGDAESQNRKQNIAKAGRENTGEKGQSR